MTDEWTEEMTEMDKLTEDRNGQRMDQQTVGLDKKDRQTERTDKYWIKRWNEEDCQRKQKWMHGQRV